MSAKPGPRGYDLLLVEDHAPDVRLLEEALRELALPHRLHVARDGIAALTALRNGTVGALSVPRPDLILLDLNLPRMDGRELLVALKSDRALASIPLLVFTTSSSDLEVTRSYAQHANAFLTKPIDLAGFLALVRAIDGFWFRAATLPPR
jgi:CheY-like chemotaxis protein